MPNVEDVVEDVLQLFEDRGDSQYGGERVTQREHALQCAALAEAAQSPPEMIVAALLHDVGHLLHHLPDDAPETGVDDRHDSSAAAYLRRFFPEAVTEPVRLHVAAKRCLCSVDADYFGRLSPPSVVSLRLQGGPMTPDEVEAYQRNRFADDALQLRRWDDAAKTPERPTPPLEHFARYVRQVAVEGGGGSR